MMRYLLKTSFCLIALMATHWLWAQQTDSPGIEMADTMRSNGKIYVVVAVLATVLLGLFLYLIRLDKRISKLEKEIH
ncbi:MAG TPA: CcmD family protein [Phnomibacter sp.]|nr:CcmD family protein [Phnomibacter sp.]